MNLQINGLSNLNKIAEHERKLERERLCGGIYYVPYIPLESINVISEHDTPRLGFKTRYELSDVKFK